MPVNIKTATTKTALEKFYFDMGEREFRKIYTEQRDMAQKRLKRLRNSEFSNTEFVQNYDDFPKLSDIHTSRDLIFQMSELNRFLGSPRSSITGQNEIRKRTVETLQQRGYDVDNSNYNDFQFLIQRARDMGLFGHLDSDQIIDDVWEKLPDGAGKENINKALRKFRKKHEGAISKAKKQRRKEEAKRVKQAKRKR